MNIYEEFYELFMSSGLVFMKIKLRKCIVILTLLFSVLVSGCAVTEEAAFTEVPVQSSLRETESESCVEPSGSTAYIIVNDNIPEFRAEEITTESFEQYSDLDGMGRCGAAFACIGIDIMPTEERGAIGQIRPTGWHTVKYEFVDGRYLYNRCHLIAYQLAGENANDKNLITGTRYLNTEGMLPFENMVAAYVKETGNHVMYRVTPDFKGDNLLANGLRMEALSVEDSGEGICFHVYVFNRQPGVTIDYATGESREEPEALAVESSAAVADGEAEYVLNNNTRRFHLPSCTSVEQIKERNRESFYGSREQLLEAGYIPCGNCNP